MWQDEERSRSRVLKSLRSEADVLRAGGEPACLHRARAGCRESRANNIVAPRFRVMACSKQACWIGSRREGSRASVPYICYHHGLRSGIVLQRIRKRKATSFGVCSELRGGGRGSYMKEHSVKAASLQFPQPGRKFTFCFLQAGKGLQPHANGRIDAVAQQWVSTAHHTPSIEHVSVRSQSEHVDKIHSLPP